MMTDEEISTLKLAAITKTDIETKIDENEEEIKVYTPYNREFVNKIHTIKGAKWSGLGYWTVPLNHDDELSKILIDVFGTDKEEDEMTVLNIKLKQDYQFDTTLTFNGFDILVLTRYRTTKLGHNVQIVSDDADIKDGGIIKKGKTFTLKIVKAKYDSIKDTFTDNNWEITDVKYYKPLNIKDLIKKRDKLIEELTKINNELHDEYGVHVHGSSTKEISLFEAVERMHRHIEKSSTQLNAKKDELDKKEEAEDADFRKHHFYVTTQDIVRTTNRAVKIQLTTKIKFWYPKGLLKQKHVNDSYYFEVSFPDDIDVKNAKNDEQKIDRKAILESFGDVDVAINKQCEYQDLWDAFSVTKHEPKPAKAKEAEVDESLKR